MESTYEKPVIRFEDIYYAVRSGDVGEPRIVIEAVGEDINPSYQQDLQLYANLPQIRRELYDEHIYIPVFAYAMAHRLVERFKGELIEPKKRG